MVLRSCHPLCYFAVVLNIFEDQQYSCLSLWCFLLLLLVFVVCLILFLFFCFFFFMPDGFLLTALIVDIYCPVQCLVMVTETDAFPNC